MANGLEKFADDVKSDPPRVVSASKLDRNFARCMPAERGLFGATKINYAHDGWSIDIAPPGSGTYVLGAVNGTLQWIATQDC
jgi:hypothetical protein